MQHFLKKELFLMNTNWRKFKNHTPQTSYSHAIARVNDTTWAICSIRTIFFLAGALVHLFVWIVLFCYCLFWQEYVHMRGEMISERYEISFRFKTSLRCSVSSLLVFTWIEAKWNSKRYGFHIVHFDRNEISNRHEIFMWT